MTYQEFVSATICDLSQKSFNELKKLLLGKYIFFFVIDDNNVTVDILAEKICDYFITLGIKTNKSFDKYIESYLNDLDSIVGSHIAKTSQAKKADLLPAVVPRSRKYYEKAISIKDIKNPTITQLIDYSRIMMCLYTAVLKNNGMTIDNFDYSVDCLIPERVVESMEKDEVSVLFPPSKKRRFDTKELYSEDVCTLILSSMLLCSVINGKVEGEADHE